MIRVATPADAAAVVEIYRPAIEAGATSFEEAVPTAAQMAERIETCLQQHPWLVDEVGGRLRGYAYAAPHAQRAAYRWSVTVSVYIANDSWRQGVGRGLYGVLFEILKQQGYCRAFAGATLPNPGSVGLHTSLGFEEVGVFPKAGFKRGTWHDVIWLHKRIVDPLPNAPAEPIPFPQLAVRWQGDLRDRS